MAQSPATAPLSSALPPLVVEDQHTYDIEKSPLLPQPEDPTTDQPAPRRPFRPRYKLWQEATLLSIAFVPFLVGDIVEMCLSLAGDIMRAWTTISCGIMVFHLINCRCQITLDTYDWHDRRDERFWRDLSPIIILWTFGFITLGILTVV